MTGSGIRATGLDNLARDLHYVSDNLDDEIREADLTVAGTVERKAKSNALALGGVAGKSAPSVDVVEGPAAAAVALGGNAYPFALGAEFGALRYPQFDTWRGSEGGYFLYPAIRQTEEQNVDTYAQAVDDLLDRAGL